MRHQRACFTGANSCLPRPLGTTWPSRNGAYLHARPDLTTCGTTHNPWTARTRPPRLATACASCGCPSRVSQVSMATTGTRTDWTRQYDMQMRVTQPRRHACLASSTSASYPLASAAAAAIALHILKPRHASPNLKSPRGGPKEGRRPPGLPPLPPPQTSPHNPSTLCWQARARDGRAGGGGTVTQPRDWPTGVGPPYSSPGQ